MKLLKPLHMDIITALTVPPPKVPPASSTASRHDNNRAQAKHEKTYFTVFYRGKFIWNGWKPSGELPGESRPRSRAIIKLQELGLVEVKGDTKGRMVRLTDAGKEYAANL